MSAGVLKERALRLGTRPGGKTIRLNINPNRYNRVNLSARVGDNYINVDLTIDEWGMFCQNIELAARSKEEVAFEIQCTKSQQHYASVWAGRDSDGLVYVRLTNKEGIDVRFEFLPLPQFRTFRNGQALPESEVTRNRAVKWVKIVEPLVIKHWELAYKEEDQGGGFQQKSGYQKRPQGNNGYSNNNGGYSNNNGGYQQRKAAPVADGEIGDYLP